jgi:hypothetical protein
MLNQEEQKNIDFLIQQLRTCHDKLVLKINSPSAIVKRLRSTVICG